MTKATNNFGMTDEMREVLKQIKNTKVAIETSEAAIKNSEKLIVQWRKDLLELKVKKEGKITLRVGADEREKDEIYTAFYNCILCDSPDIQEEFSYCPGCGIKIEWRGKENDR